MRAATCTRALAVALSLAVLGCGGAGDELGDDAGEVGDDEQPALGDTPLPGCEAVVFIHDQLAAELLLPSPDPAYVTALYRGQPPDDTGESPISGGSALQRWVREVDARLGRVEAGVLRDDAAIEGALEQALAASDPALVRTALIDIVARLRLVASLDIRARIAAVSEVVPDPARDPALLEAEWDQAYCTWSGILAPLASEADALATGQESGDWAGWGAQIDAGFESGHAGIRGPEQDWAPDELATKPAKQIIEKSLFAVVHRVVLARAAAAQAGGDADLAREALGLFAILEDRVAGRNTPALAEIDAMLAGDPGAIEVGEIEAMLGVAFVKRARKYCDEALEAGTLGTADGVKGAWEGIIYTRVVVPLMRERLADEGFDEDEHLAAWDAYLIAVRDDDANAAVEISAGLVEWNCALQQALGVEACTASDDEN